MLTGLHDFVGARLSKFVGVDRLEPVLRSAINLADVHEGNAHARALNRCPWRTVAKRPKGFNAKQTLNAAIAA